MSAARLPQTAAAPSRACTLPARRVATAAIGQKRRHQEVTRRATTTVARAQAINGPHDDQPVTFISTTSTPPNDDDPTHDNSTTPSATATATARRPSRSSALLAASMAAAAATQLIITPTPSAHAADAVVSWKPRRHHRHIGERFTDRWADAVAEAEEQGRERVRELERRLAAANARADGEAATRQAAEARLRALQQSQAVSGGRGGQGYYDEWPVALRVLGADVTPLLLVGAAAFGWWRAHSSGALAEWTGGRLGSNARRRRRGGRWVYDRSLGGKRVWVPEAGDEGDFGGGGAGGGGGGGGGLGGLFGGGKKASLSGSSAMSDADFDALAARAANASVAAGASALSAASPTKKQQEAVPEWWESAQPRRLAGLDARTKGEARAEAQRLLRRMEQAKNAGEDYPLEMLLALRSACQQAGTLPGQGEALVDARTVGGRDALFRATVDAAVRAASEPGSVDLGGEDPLRLCAAMAGDLGVADARAVSVVRGRLAGAARARVVEAIAALSRGDGGDGEGGDSNGGDGDALLALDKLASLLEGMPGVLGGELAGGEAAVADLASAARSAAPVAPEVELVASELNKWAPVPARERVLALYCQLDPARAALVARMLDFDPSVALERVAARLAAARAASSQDEGAA
jgi:hypothetical protein